MIRRTAAKRKPPNDPIAAELSRLRAEVVAMGQIVGRLERELSAALRPTPESDPPWGDLVGVAEASETADVEPQTIRRWMASGAPIGAYVESLGIFLISRRRLREYLGARNGTLAG